MSVPSCPICGSQTAERSHRVPGEWWCWTCNTCYFGGESEWNIMFERRKRYADSLIANAIWAEKLAAIRETKAGAAAMTGKEPEAKTA